MKSVKNLDRDSFQVLRKIDDLSCAGKRAKVPEAFFMQPIGFDHMERWLTQKKSLIALSVHAQPLDPDDIKSSPELASQPDWDRHGILVYGATIRNVNGTNVCFYKVKNSWGPNACMNVWGNKNSPKVQCDPSTGSYLVSSDLLESMALSIQQ